MAGDNELKEHALNSAQDFYALPEIPESASAHEIRRAYRRTALKYHPDKVGASDTAALEKFHLLQIAYDVLLDENVRALYDNARRAREEKKEREAAYEGRRRNLKEELELREAAGAKRKRQEANEEDLFQRELQRLAVDGARRRKEREEKLRQEASELVQSQANTNCNTGHNGQPASGASSADKASSSVSDVDRTIQLKFWVSSANDKETDWSLSDRDDLVKQLSRFGKIEDAVLRSKKIKIEGQKHRRECTTALVVFQSIVDAHAAIVEIPRLKSRGEVRQWQAVESIDWAAGKEPDCIAHLNNMTPQVESLTAELRPSQVPDATQLNDDMSASDAKKLPSFGSFKAKPRASPIPSSLTTGGSPSLEELTLIRLKNAERKRLADKLRKEEAEAQMDRSMNN